MATQYAMRSKRRWALDHWLGICSMVISTAVAVLFGYATIASDYVERDRLAKVDGARTEAAFVQACLDYESFVIDQYRAGLSEEQIEELIPVVLLVLRTGYHQSPQTCPAVSEIVAALDAPPK